jgi:predicted acyltransferase
LNSSQRILALDVFRGMTISLMILVNNPGTWAHVYAPFRHAKWHGCTLTDLVFPFFLFIAGTAMRFSLGKVKFCRCKDVYVKIFWRAVTIFAFGILLNAFPFIRQDWDWSHFRIMGVLQRIGIAYGIGAFLVLRFSFKQLWGVIFSTLVGYWIILWGFGGPAPFSLENNMVRMIDLTILGESHLWTGTRIPFDPEGLFSTLPAIATLLMGYMAGVMIHTAVDMNENVKKMFISGGIQIVAGLVWSLAFPLNKSLWTSSYVLFTAGLASIILAGLIWCIDLKGIKKIFWPFVVYGTNSIFLFVGSGLWTKTILKVKFSLDEQSISGYSYLYKTIFQPLAGDLNGSILFALFHVIMWWLILLWLYRQKIFIKI